MTQTLNGRWDMTDTESNISVKADIPGSVYSTLIKHKIIPDPYCGLNQYDALKYSEKDYVFERDFVPENDIKSSDKVYLRFEGIDTAADIFLNDKKIGTADNMHRAYEFDVTKKLLEGSNHLKVYIHSPIGYINRMNEKNPLWGVASTMAGYPHMRKAHYMFGWDWGPALPDMGIWRDVELVGVTGGRIESVYVSQQHKESSVKLDFDAVISDICGSGLRMEVVITSPDGSKSVLDSNVSGKNAHIECVITNPSLWNVRGYGRQDLYMVNILLYSADKPVDVKSFNIGLRTVEVSRTIDDRGEEFAFVVNGIKIFAMGANYIPEDNILSRCSVTRTKELLKDCAAANYNMIRVWGGGIYPEDYFYDLCDKLGILVWQDMMFACSVYDGNDISFCTNVRGELIHNVKRARNHACLALWCGNNEIESAWQYWGLPQDEELKDGYLRMFENIAPKVVEQFDPNTVYWPSSPSSGGGFNDSGAKNKGDIHYWEVWHSLKPFTEYKKYLFRFCSEYGFESVPCMKTVKYFAQSKDMNLMSPVMEAHQKCENGNEKLLYYIAQTVHYPYSFEDLIYASQLVQADAVRLNAEQMRRHRGVCMGSLYWQVNDSNPVISWSSIDYFGRWKALHYYAKKFYAPVLCSVDDSDRERLTVNVSNEKTAEFSGVIRWRARRNTAEIIAEGETSVTVPPLSAKDCLIITPRMTGITEEMYSSCYIEYTLLQNNAVVSGSTYMFCPPKQFEFLPPEISFDVDKIGGMYRIRLHSGNFAKGVYLDFDDMDCVFSDNWFDMHGQDMYVIISRQSFPPNVTEKEVGKQLKVKSYYDLYDPENYR